MLTTDPDIAVETTDLAPGSSRPAGEVNLATPVEDDPLASKGPFAALKRALGNGEVIRFLIVGCVNTGFSYLLYVGFGILFTALFPHLDQAWVADAAVIVSWPISVTFSFLGFKHFVFHTKGNYRKEWLRCLAVYSVTVPASLVIVAVATKGFQLTPLPSLWDKYAAGIVNSLIIATYSYVANKKYSFKKS